MPSAPAAQPPYLTSDYEERERVAVAFSAQGAGAFPVRPCSEKSPSRRNNITAKFSPRTFESP